MKCLGVVCVVTVLATAGCVYNAPLTEEHVIPVDPALVGLWEEIPDEGQEPDNRMMILKYSATEYLVHYPTDGDQIYYRAYPVDIGGILCVQLRALGTDEGPVAEGEGKLFHVARYRLSEGTLEVKMLNTGLVGRELKSSDELTQAFLKHREDPDLFTDPGRFRRVEKQ